MKEPNEDGAETPGAVVYELPEIRFTPDGQHSVESSDDTAPPAPVPAQVPPQASHAEAAAPVESAAEVTLVEDHPSSGTIPSPTCATHPGWTAG
jgi:hypothetical protein